jgi:hypothetical protein
MTALTLPWTSPDRGTVLRGIAAGAVWGIAVATALLGLSLYRCGGICLGQIVETAALSVAVGIVTIGPLALFRREAHRLLWSWPGLTSQVGYTRLA